MTSLVFLIFHSLFAFSAATCGGRQGGLVCCSGYSWNRQHQMCTKCPSGHFGVNCSGTCIYPTYGELCRNICSCGREKCDKANGCLNDEDQHSTVEASPVVVHYHHVQIPTPTTAAQLLKYNKTDNIEQKTCFECNASYTTEIHHHYGHNAVQIAMICTTACLSLVLVIVLLSKVHKCCKRSKVHKCCKRSIESNKGLSKITDEEHYDELDEGAQASELKGNFLVDEVADAKIAFDKSQKRYFIEFPARSSSSPGERGSFRCQNCAIKEECAMASQAKQEKKTGNNYILPSLCNAEEPSWNNFDDDTQPAYLGCKDTRIQIAEEDTYLVATSARL